MNITHFLVLLLAALPSSNLAFPAAAGLLDGIDVQLPDLVNTLLPIFSNLDASLQASYLNVMTVVYAALAGTLTPHQVFACKVPSILGWDKVYLH